MEILTHLTDNNFKEPSQLQHQTNLTFYTDGSLRTRSPTQPNTFLGGRLTAITYKGRTTFTPSPSKAEGIAILTAILICSSNSTVDIYTDSQNAISTYYRISNKLTSERRILKISNHLIWRLIHHLVTFNNIQLTFHKVKAHSEIHFNELADTLTKEDQDINPSLLTRKFYLLPDDAYMGFHRIY
ncbi:hypothetical protein RhiirA1_461507 [Rhizophagus irregularis]|uniref:Uncharacterized protein n=1 Tax=Rhizophagus irregularis TaxID=588596 RepID=A0A2I1EME2_9GLOM|nr:hypothetical protein RhiirA1_461507 [Rhizophagus irregularis]PKY23301.1 hypothetical protein RhiirB3_437479 [Rhizophagus irregularis]